MGYTGTAHRYSRREATVARKSARVAAGHARAGGRAVRQAEAAAAGALLVDDGVADGVEAGLESAFFVGESELDEPFESPESLEVPAATFSLPESFPESLPDSPDRLSVR